MCAWQPINARTNKPVVLKTADWPVLVHGTNKSAASFFTIALTADLIRHDKKVVYLCAQGDSLRSLQKELNLNQPIVKRKNISSDVAESLVDMQLVTLFKHRGTNLEISLRALPNWTSRVVVICNAEKTLTPELWEMVRSHQELILSGDLEKVKTDFDQNIFSTSAAFSATPGHWHHQRQHLPSYIGDVQQQTKKSQVIIGQVAH